MNRTKINLILAILALAAIFGMTSCQKEDPISVTTDETYEYVSFGTLVETIQVSNLDLENEMMLLNEMEPQKIEKGGMLAGKVPMYRFKEIFAKLKITEDQKADLDKVFKIHIDCETAARKAFFEKIASIMDEANTARKDIMEQVKAGKLDKVAAKELLKALDKATKEKITASGAQEELKIALKKCTDELIAAIREILDENQDKIFDEWLAKGGSNIGTGNGGGKGNGKDPGNGGGKDPGNGGGKDPGNGSGTGPGNKPLNPIYVKLSFTLEQIKLSEPVFKAHDDCEKLAYELFNKKVAPLFEAAKAARQVIMDKLKSGEMDKVTAQQELQKIDIDLKTKIVDSGAQAELEAALKLCDEDLIKRLKEIMSDKQDALFDNLLARGLITLHGPAIGPKK